MTGIMRIAVLSAALLLPFSEHAFAQCSAPNKFGGKWVANDGGTYHLRRLDDTLWWVGEAPDWTHIFRGTIDGNTVRGEWADIYSPGGSGTLTLRVRRADSGGIVLLERIGSSGDGFAGERWQRPCDD